MNKRYMDFTPVKSTSQPTSRDYSRPIVQMPDGNTTMRTRTVSRTVGRTMAALPQSSHREVSRATMRGTTVSAGSGASVRMVRTASQQTMSRRVVPQQGMNRRNVVGCEMVGQMAGRQNSSRQSTVSRVTYQQVAPQQRSLRRGVSRQPMVNSRSDIKGGRVVPSEIRLGEIEDLNAKFVMTDVPKRPLGEGNEPLAMSDYVEEDIAEEPVVKESAKTKSRKLGGRFRGKKVAAKESIKKAAKTQSKETGKGATSGKTQGTPFINQDKVAKRPLSKRASTNKVTIPAKEITTDKPVTIIAKPKKDSRVGVVIAIILTIILGAVAGTVAFLLLPK